ncbi:MAG: hypothetical protein MZW92_47790 [Comamonadaceae bacterium]|nr:hypothetical protein [Comamonadaceae bacterium]
MSTLDVDTKLAAARTRLVLDKPFLGALVLRLPLKEARPSWCRSVATDARHFYFNRAYIAKLSVGADPVRAGPRGAALRAVALRAPRPPRTSAAGIWPATSPSIPLLVDGRAAARRRKRADAATTTRA